MSENICIALISSITTICVGVLTAVVAYKSSVRGATIQINHANDKLKTEMEKQNNFAKSAVEKFITHEIKMNFAKISSKSRQDVIDSLKVSDKPFKHSYGKKFDYTEYDRLKYDLIKYNSEIIDEVMSIYEIFFLLDLKEDFINFTQEEFDNFKKVYLMALEKYK